MKTNGAQRGGVVRSEHVIVEGTNKHTKAELKYWKAYEEFTSRMHDDPRVFCPCKGPML